VFVSVLSLTLSFHQSKSRQNAAYKPAHQQQRDVMMYAYITTIDLTYVRNFCFIGLQ